MKILITGSNGFLGKHFFNELKDTHSVFGLNRSTGDYIVNLEKQRPSNMIFFDMVIHAAGMVHVIPTDNHNDDNPFFKVNVNGTKNLLAVLNGTNRPKYFVYISSVSVYGLTNGMNISENDPLLASDPYGKSKIQAEKMIREWCANNNVVCTILRLPLIVGVAAPGNLNRMARGIKRGYYFNINKGEAKKSMVLATDVAKHVVKAGLIGGVYNLTDGCHPTFREISSLIANRLNKETIYDMPLFVAKILAIVGDLLCIKHIFSSEQLTKLTTSLTFNDDAARKAFGWNPRSVVNYFEY